MIIIEATWLKGAVVAKADCLSKIPHIRLKSRSTTYWRTQELGKEYLSTIEAIYYSCLEFVSGHYDGSFDDLLLPYAHIHSVVMKNDHKPKLWRLQGAEGLSGQHEEE